MNKFIKIGKKKIGAGSPCFIIAEASINHNGRVSLAKKMANEAKKAGADCIKFQTFTASEFCADKKQKIELYSNGKKKIWNLYNLYKKHEFSVSQWKEIKKYCDKIGIIFMSTVQDPINFKLLKKIGIKAIKVGSDDFDNISNLKYYAKTKLPMIISRGMSDIKEIKNIIDKIYKINKKLAVLHCVSIYPSSSSELNLKQILSLQKVFPKVIWGYSDHSLGTLAPAIAVTLGSKIIEKHFTLDNKLLGPDHSFSVNPKQLKELVDNIRFTENSLGTEKIFNSKKEIKNKNFMRRRIVAKKDLSSGTKINNLNISFKRSSSGLFINQLNKIKGKTLKVAKKKDASILIRDIKI